jgi:sodium transport system permease protein
MIGPLLRNELRMLLRDTRTILIAVVAPLALLPAYILITGFVENREAERIESATYTYALVGPEAAWGARTVAAAVALPADSGEVRTTFEAWELPDAVAPGDREALADSLLREGEIQLVVVARDAQAADSLDADTPVLALRYRSESDLSRAARGRLEDRLDRYRETVRGERYDAAGFPVERSAVAIVVDQNVATAGKEGGLFLARVLLPLVVMLMLAGGSIIAADTISGEKERGTLETLLTSAARRSEIVRAKLLAVIVVGLAVVVVNVANLALYLTIGVLELPEGLALQLTVGQLGLLLVMFVPLAGLVAAALLLISGFAKSYREYQLYQPVVFLLFLLPSLAALLPGLELRSAVVLLPIAGLSVATSAVLAGGWSALWGLAAIASTGVAAVLLLRWVEIVLSNERLITSAGWDEADFRGGAALFPRHVLTWFLALWVVFFLVSLWFGESLGVRGQIVINLVGVFLGGSAWLVHRYRLDPVEVLSLRRPGWTAWPAVAIGAPSFLVLGMGVAQLVNTYLFPVPESLLEAFSRGLTLDLGVIQLLFFLSLMPGVLEEIAFRGVLLHGLRKRLSSPWVAAVACGAIFGLFHVSLFRIVPTGLLGVALAMVVIRTRSIYPAMLWHLLNNALALIPAHFGWIDADFAVPAWGFVVAGFGVVASFVLLRPAQR